MPIERTTPADAPEIAALMTRTLQISVDLSAEEMEGAIENVMTNLQLALDYPSQSLHLKAVKGREIVGVIQVKNFWNLCSLFVDPQYQRMGIGRDLLLAAIEHCVPHNDRGHIRLNSSLNAVAFYEGMGFVFFEDGERHAATMPMIHYLK